MSHFESYATEVMRRCDLLGDISQTPGIVDRRYLSAQHKKANELVADWMSQAGMSTWQDAAGNQWGRYASRNEQAKTLLMGSHLDTVPNGGKYDGMLGVIAPLALMQYFHDNQIVLPFHIDIVGFGDEEGTRFGSTLLGSRALTNTWPQQWASLKDEDGVSLEEAMRRFGLEFNKVSEAAVDPRFIHAYLEVHIEQGPVLEQRQQALGVVTAIAGARRFLFEVTGFAGHAGTVPMDMRQDALAAVAEMTLAVESVSREYDVVATVGYIENSPNGVNVISGKTKFSLDLRSGDDTERDRVLDLILRKFHNIALKRNVEMSFEQTHEAPAVACHPSLQQQLANAIAQTGTEPVSLFSGAGHDAMAIAKICPVAMLFVRCDRGISHHPAEAIMEADVNETLIALNHFVQHFQTDFEQ